MTLQDLINTISEDPSQVREALELIKRQLPAYPEATEAADADFIPLTKAGGGTEKLPLPILDQRSVTPLPDITALSSLDTGALVDGQQFRRKEFWPGTGVGGVDLYWDASRPVSEHNGGTIIDPAKISELDTVNKTFGTYFTPASGDTGCFVVENLKTTDSTLFGVIPSSTIDSTPAYQAMIDWLQPRSRTMTLPPFETAVEGTLTLYGGKWNVCGFGTFSVLRKSTDTPWFRVDLNRGGFDIGRFQNFRFRGPGAAAGESCEGIQFYTETAGTGDGASYCTFENLSATGLYRVIHFWDNTRNNFGGIPQINRYGNNKFLNICVDAESGGTCHEVIKYDAGPGAHNEFLGGTYACRRAGVRMGQGTANAGIGDQTFQSLHILDGDYGLDIVGPSDLSRYRENVRIIGCHFDGINANPCRIIRMKNFTISKCSYNSGRKHDLTGSSEYEVDHPFIRMERFSTVRRHLPTSGLQVCRVSRGGRNFSGGVVEFNGSAVVGGVGVRCISQKWHLSYGSASWTISKISEDITPDDGEILISAVERDGDVGFDITCPNATSSGHFSINGEIHSSEIVLVDFAVR